MLLGIVPRFLYVIKMEQHSLFKIGITNNLEKRKRDLQTANPFSFRYVLSVEVDLNDYFGKGIIYLEQFLYQNYESCRVSGEWYKLSMLDICKYSYFLSLLFIEGIYVQFIIVVMIWKRYLLMYYIKKALQVLM